MKLKEVVQKFETTELFISAVNEQLKKIMKENPKFIYNEEIGSCNCFYNRGPTNNPYKCKGCIFGQALQNLGWSDSEELDCIGNINILFINYCYLGCIPNYWEKIQSMQDIGSNWGSLLEYLPKD